MRKKYKLVYGVGVNDADYMVYKWGQVDGKKTLLWRCRYYKTWKEMLKRCYSASYHKLKPTYKGCTVCTEWLSFSNFKSWMEQQDWEGKQLDKDLLFKGNKTHSPETCRFIDSNINLFLTDSAASRGDYPLGVSLDKRGGKFLAYCNNPFTKTGEYLGYFSCPMKAHEAWRRRKHEHACALADLQSDERVSKALRERFKPTQ